MHLVWHKVIFIRHPVRIELTTLTNHLQDKLSVFVLNLALGHICMRIKLAVRQLY